jgi:hypothetical protein
LQFQETQKNVVETAVKDGVPLPSPAERASFLAEHLINFSLSTAADRHEASSLLNTIKKDGATYKNSNRVRITSEDLKNLPFEVATVENEEAVSSVAENADGGIDDSDSGSGNDKKTEQKAENVRQDVFGDLACVSISLQWPNQGHQSMFQPPPPRLFHPTTAGNSRREALAPFNFQDSASSDLAPLARYRWSQLRMVVDYHRLHRREVLQRWQETVHGILKKAQQRAKAVAYKVENEHGIAVNVSPLMKLSAKDGRSLPSSAFNVKASINF